jgi:hypothetical protein
VDRIAHVAQLFGIHWHSPHKTHSSSTYVRIPQTARLLRLQNFLGLLFAPDGQGLAAFARGLRSAATSAAADPGLTWLWGAAAAALLVAVLARLPDPGSPGSG